MDPEVTLVATVKLSLRDWYEAQASVDQSAADLVAKVLTDYADKERKQEDQDETANERTSPEIL